MGSSMHLNRKYIPKRPRETVIRELADMVEPLGIKIIYESAASLYLWRQTDIEGVHKGIRVYADTAKENKYPEPFGMYYREIFFEAVYDDDEVMNSDLLLEMTAAYMKKYPDTLLLGECSPYLYYDKQDIDAVMAQPFRADWYYMTKSHISPLLQDAWALWYGKEKAERLLQRRT